jgi:hypothetical protein
VLAGKIHATAGGGVNRKVLSESDVCVVKAILVELLGAVR